MMRYILQGVLVLGAAFFLLGQDAHAAKPMGIALKTKGEVCVKTGSSTECPAVRKGTKFYPGQEIIVSAGAVLTLLDLEGKQRVALEEGSYEVEAGEAEDDKNTASSRLAKLLEFKTAKTAVGGTRIGVCQKGAQEASNVFGVSSPAEWMQEGACFIKDCVEKLKINNSDAEAVLLDANLELPQYSYYLDLPSLLETREGGQWALVEGEGCTLIKAGEKINIDEPVPATFLVRPGQKRNRIWAMLLLPKAHREELDEEIRNYQEIWTDTKQTDYLWAMYELYNEFGLTYEGLKVMLKIKETSN